MVLALSFSCALLAQPALRAAELDGLIAEYEAAKKELQASRRQAKSSAVAALISLPASRR